MSLSFSLPPLQAITPGPAADFWYQPLAVSSVTGHQITPETAMKVSTVYACVRVLSSTLAMLPLQVYRRRADGGKDIDRTHPLFPVLHGRPNAWQTSYQWRQMLMGHLALRGNAYCEKEFDGQGRVRSLIPLHPDRMRILEQQGDGQIRYEYRAPNGTRSELTSGELFTLTGFSSDGFTGLSVIALMRDSVGLALSTQEFGGRLFRDAPMMKGLLKQNVGRAMDEEQEKRLTASFARAHSGSNAHGVALLPPGLEWEQVGMTAEDSQFLETRSFQVEDLLRFLGVPGVLVGHADKTSTYASAEQFFQSFFTYHMAPWFVLWEQAIQRDLIREPDDAVFVEFTREGLLRGDSAARATFYRTMIELGVFTRNEVRSLENRNPLDGLDEPLTPKNMQVGQSVEVSAEPPQPSAGDHAHRDRLIEAVAARLTRKEVSALTKAAQRHASNPQGFADYASSFYDKFLPEVAAECAVSSEVVASYVRARREAVQGQGATALTAWASDEGRELAAVIRESLS